MYMNWKRLLICLKDSFYMLFDSGLYILTAYRHEVFYCDSY